jgi:hypothetical protein
MYFIDAYSFHSRYFLRWILYDTHAKIHLSPKVGHKPHKLNKLAYGNELTPQNTVLLEKLETLQLIKKFPVLYGT